MHLDDIDAIILDTQFSGNTAGHRGLHLYAQKEFRYDPGQGFLEGLANRRLTAGNCHFDSTLVPAKYAGTSMIYIFHIKARFEQCQVDTAQHGKDAGFIEAKSLAEFTLTQSTIRFRNAAQMTLANAYVRLTGNSFKGNGTINVGEGKDLLGVQEVSVLANTFDGVLLKMGDVTKSEVIFRNNKGIRLDVPDSSTFRTCHPVDGGFAAGCDIRATCETEGKPWNVQCSCEKSGLEAAKVAQNTGLVGSIDGSTCVQPKTFEVLSATTQVQFKVRKPRTSMSQFQIKARGDESFNVTVQVVYSQPSNHYLVVDTLACKLQQTGLVAMSLSNTKSDKTCNFNLSAVGSRTSWHDHEEKKAVVQVSHGDASYNLSVLVALQPYLSCTHTKFELSSNHTRHDVEMELKIWPRDTDDLPLTKTEFEYRLVLWYAQESLLDQVIRAGHADTNKSNSVRIPKERLRRQGTYSVLVKLLDAWNHTAGKPLICELPPAIFTVSCAGGFGQGTNSSDCVRRDFTEVCEKAVVKVGDQLLQKSNNHSWVSVQITESESLSVSVDRSSTFGGSAKVQLMSLKGSKEAELNDHRVNTTLTDTGHFTLILSDEHSSCALQSLLKIECETDYEAKGTHCIKQPEQDQSMCL